MLKATDCTGDCGVEAMAFFSKRPRFPSEWKKIRGELADYMAEVSGIQVWQDAYRSCQEDVAAAPLDHSASCGGMGPPPVLEGTVKRQVGLTQMPARGSSASSSSASGTSGSNAASSLSLPGPGLQPDAIAALAVAGSELAAAGSGGVGPLEGTAMASTSTSSLVGSALVAVVPASSAPSLAELDAAASASVAPQPEPELEVAAALVFVEPAATATDFQPSEGPPPPLPPPPLPPAIVVAGPQAFRDWLTSMPALDLEAISCNYAAFKAAEILWQDEHKSIKASASACTLRRRNTASKAGFRLATGLAYLEWRRGVGAASRSPLKAVRRLSIGVGGFHGDTSATASPAVTFHP